MWGGFRKRLEDLGVHVENLKWFGMDLNIQQFNRVSAENTVFHVYLGYGHHMKLKNS